MTTVLLGLGSNLDEPVSQLRRAVERIETAMSIDAVSNVYRTEPVGGVEQPDFFNICCRGHTDLAPTRLHARLSAIEDELGRRRVIPGGPRTIDIDLLGFGQMVLDTSGLVIPHPRMHQRAFVLVPLAEIAPEWRHPVLNATVSELLDNLRDRGRVEYWGPLGAGPPDCEAMRAR